MWSLVFDILFPGFGLVCRAARQNLRLFFARYVLFTSFYKSFFV